MDALWQELRRILHSLLSRFYGVVGAVPASTLQLSGRGLVGQEKLY